MVQNGSKGGCDPALREVIQFENPKDLRAYFVLYLQGKYLAMFIARNLIEGTVEAKEYTERERKEAKAIAAIRVNQMIDSQHKKSDAEIKGHDGQNSEQETPFTPQQARPLE